MTQYCSSHCISDRFEVIGHRKAKHVGHEAKMLVPFMCRPSCVDGVQPGLCIGFKITIDKERIAQQSGSEAGKSFQITFDGVNRASIDLIERDGRCEGEYAAQFQSASRCLLAY